MEKNSEQHKKHRLGGPINALYFKKNIKSIDYFKKSFGFSKNISNFAPCLE